jgi:hypothetical protein
VKVLRDGRGAGQIATQIVRLVCENRDSAIECCRFVILCDTGMGLALSHSREKIPGAAAMNNAASMSINPLFLRHDLMIELGRLEMAIDDVRTTQPAANDRNNLVCELETKCARINEALSKLPA